MSYKLQDVAYKRRTSYCSSGFPVLAAPAKFQNSMGYKFHRVQNTYFWSLHADLLAEISTMPQYISTLDTSELLGKAENHDSYQCAHNFFPVMHHVWIWIRIKMIHAFVTKVHYHAVPMHEDVFNGYKYLLSHFSSS